VLSSSKVAFSGRRVVTRSRARPISAGANAAAWVSDGAPVRTHDHPRLERDTSARSCESHLTQTRFARNRDSLPRTSRGGERAATGSPHGDLLRRDARACSDIGASAAATLWPEFRREADVALDPSLRRAGRTPDDRHCGWLVMSLEHVPQRLGLGPFGRPFCSADKLHHGAETS
jgi:hypothetical protein